MSPFFKPLKLTEADEAKLLGNYRESGDLSVLGRLYERQMPLVYGVCLKYLKEEELAKDGVMEIFEELIVKVKMRDVKEFRSWLYVVARNYCLMKLRSGKKMETVNFVDFMEFVPILHPDDNNREAAMMALEKCMGKLPSMQKQSIDLFYFKEQCYKEIAGITGFSLNEVKSYIQNGKRNLKLCLEKVSE